MANISAGQRSATISYSPAQSLCIIVGLACLAGFIVDITILALPPDPFNIQWRINLLQQMGDRSIVLLFGLALIMYGFLSNRMLRKQLALGCLAIGVMFSVSGILMAHDSLKFQDMTLVNIASQEDQVRNQIESAQENPQEVAPEVTPEILEQATRQLSRRAESAKKTAKTGIIKIGASSISNLIVTGVALIALGRFGNRTAG
ncbi:MAG: hypothetical protein F6K11_24410 [Leptolyngbya sp. SIO3F4]|nr:hypothetical protein [Leptolyngbya sp. SIO3F4]